MTVDHRDAHDIGYYGAVRQKQSIALRAAVQVHDSYIGAQCVYAHPTRTTITTVVCFQNTRQNETMRMFSGGFLAMVV